MNPMMNMMPGTANEGPNLFDILVNVAFGFIAGMILFLGFKEVIDFGTKIAGNLAGPQMSMAPGGLASYASYIVIAPIGGLVVKQLTAVRSLKSFAFFAVAVIVGLVIAYFSQGYFKALMIPH